MSCLLRLGGGPFEIEAGVRKAQERIEIAQSQQNTFAQADMSAVMGGTVLVGLVFIVLNIFSKFFDPRAK